MILSLWICGKVLCITYIYLNIRILESFLYRIWNWKLRSLGFHCVYNSYTLVSDSNLFFNNNIARLVRMPAIKFFDCWSTLVQSWCKFLIAGQHWYRVDVSFWLLVNTGVSMCRSPQVNISYEFILISLPACFAHLSLWDGR